MTNNVPMLHKWRTNWPLDTASKRRLCYYIRRLCRIRRLCFCTFRPREFEHWSSTPSSGIRVFIDARIVLNWAISWLLEENDALTLSVSGSLKSTMTGLIVCTGLFDPTYIFSWQNFLGLQTTALSSFLYMMSGR